MNKTRVLLADNNNSELRRWAKSLSAAGYEVSVASTVAAVKERLAKEEYDLAILDLHMDSETEEEGDDNSGLELAIEADARLVLPVLLTGDEKIAGPLRVSRKGLKLRIPVYHKQDGPGGLDELVAREERSRPTAFLSHGHDEAAREEVARFLKKQRIQNRRLRVVVLQDVGKIGHTIIDRFEQYSDVNFAVVLLTPDDVGHSRKEPLRPRHRARQNVIFELGYLIAKLGRSRVMPLFKEDGQEFEMPTNYAGVVYVKLDSEGKWQRRLRNEIKAL